MIRTRRKRPPRDYRDFIMRTDWPCCWACGRYVWHCPEWWAGPFFIHRAHVVSHPRVEDARVIVLLDPMCHGRAHGERYAAEPDVPALTVANLLWLKITFDKPRFDREFLQRHSVQRLPEPEPLPAWYDDQWSIFQTVPRPQP